MGAGQSDCLTVPVQPGTMVLAMTDANIIWTRPATSGSLLTRAIEDQQAISAAMESVELADGGSLRVLDCGRGDAILLMPMVSELNFVYAPQIAELQADHRVVLYEPRLSPSTRVGIADRAEEALALLATLGISSAHVIVWGDTGSAAYHLARHHPTACRSLVFIGLADRYHFPWPYGPLLSMLEHLPMERVASPRVFATLLGRLVGGTQIRPEWITQRAAEIPRLTALFKQSIQPNLTEHRPRHGEVLAPSLVIGGDNDRIVSVAQARRMAELLPNAGPAVIVDGGEHFVNYVDEATVNEEIRRFFAALPQGLR
jgi:pimeloyl-ACP methyl ester carboxylesterase